MLDELLITLPPADFNALADYFDRSLLNADPGPTLIDGAGEAVHRLAGRYRLGVIWIRVYRSATRCANSSSAMVSWNVLPAPPSLMRSA